MSVLIHTATAHTRILVSLIYVSIEVLTLPLDCYINMQYSLFSSDFLLFSSSTHPISQPSSSQFIVQSGGTHGSNDPTAISTTMSSHVSSHAPSSRDAYNGSSTSNDGLGTTHSTAIPNIAFNSHGNGTGGSVGYNNFDPQSLPPGDVSIVGSTHDRSSSDSLKRKFGTDDAMNVTSADESSRIEMR